MADNANTLDKARALIEERLEELEDEKKRLERALGNLKGERRGPGRPPGSGSRTRRGRSAAKAPGGKRRRRRRGGTRADHALKAVTENPGMTASQIAEKLKIKPNYVYRVMSELTADGKVKKDGRGYTATGA